VSLGGFRHIPDPALAIEHDAFALSIGRLIVHNFELLIEPILPFLVSRPLSPSSCSQIRSHRHNSKFPSPEFRIDLLEGLSFLFQSGSHVVISGFELSVGQPTSDDGEIHTSRNEWTAIEWRLFRIRNSRHSLQFTCFNVAKR
jgi:hypothetical protein